MDSKTREALEYIRCLDINPSTTSLSATKRVRMAVAKASEALSLLTTEPEPCEDLETLVDDICDPSSKLWEGETSDLDGRPETYLGPEKVKRAIDAYASRHEQGARADERRQAAERADHEVFGWLVGCQRMALRAAILQGTEPAKVSEDVERDAKYLRRFIQDHAFPAAVAYDLIASVDRLVARIKEGNRG